MRARGPLSFLGPSHISANGERSLSFGPGNPIDTETARFLESLDGLFGERAVAPIRRAR
jgi:hypothetical protein